MLVVSFPSVFFTDFSHPVYIYIYIYSNLDIVKTIHVNSILFLFSPLLGTISLSDSSLLHHYKFKIKKFLQKKIQYIMMFCFHQKGDGALTTFLMIFLQIIKKYSQRFWRSSFNLISAEKPQLNDENTRVQVQEKQNFKGI